MFVKNLKPKINYSSVRNVIKDFILPALFRFSYYNFAKLICSPFQLEPFNFFNCTNIDCNGLFLIVLAEYSKLFPLRRNNLTSYCKNCL